MDRSESPASCACLIATGLSWFAFVGMPMAVQGQDVPTLRPAPATATATRAFTSISGIRELSDGRVVLADRSERILVLLGADLGSSATMGRPGQGPREYGIPFRIHPLPGDSSIVTDAATRGWFILDGPEIVDTWRGRRVPTERMEMDFEGIAGGERIVGLRTHRYTSPDALPGLPLGPTHADSVAVLMAGSWSDEGDGTPDTLAVIAGRGNRTFCMSVATDSRRSDPIGGCSPISGQDLVLPFPDGWIAFLYHSPYHVEWRNPDGAWVQGEPLPLEPRPLSSSPEEQCLALLRYPFREVEGPCSRGDLAGLDWPADVPPFLGWSASRMAAPATPGAFAAPDGRLVVRRTPGLRFMENRYDLLNREGALEAVLVLPANEAIVGFGRNSVYLVETDEFDLQTLRRHPWPW